MKLTTFHIMTVRCKNTWFHKHRNIKKEIILVSESNMIPIVQEIKRLP